MIFDCIGKEIYVVGENRGLKHILKATIKGFYYEEIIDKVPKNGGVFVPRTDVSTEFYMTREDAAKEIIRQKEEELIAIKKELNIN